VGDSGEAAEVVRRFYAARRRGDRAAAARLVEPDAEFDLSASESPYRGIYRGRTEIEDLWSATRDSWSENWIEIEQEVVRGDRVAVGVRHHTRGRSSGIEAVARGAQVLTVRGGQIVEMRLFQSWDDALEAIDVPSALE
jgi:ketosteroid isomerase-like protein